jgi:hypothetical protein
MRVLALLSFFAPLAAQWSTNPLHNLPVSDRSGDQAVPKIAATSDGGCYIAWFDNNGGSYAVALQRLDPAGREQWPHHGITVSSHAQNTSLVDWDLIVDRQDHAVLAFTDSRNGPDLDVYAYRIAPAGTFVWGANGIALTTNAGSNTDAEANPRLCLTSNNNIVCVWPNTTARTLVVQRLDLMGNFLWANPVVIAGDAGDTPAFARVVAGERGSVIISWVRALAFAGTKHIHTQKLDAAGAPLWGAQRFALFDAASVPIAHEPRLLPDGQGGAIYAWHYAAGSVFHARVQRMLAGGTEAFAHNGVDVATHAMSKLDPALVWHGTAQEILVFWNERNTAQSSWGISGQKFDAAGNRLWGGSGAVLLPVNTTNKLAPVATSFGGGAQVFVLETSLGPIQHKVLGMRVLGSGALAGPVVEASRVVSEKLRLQAATSSSGVAMLCWTDRRADSGDIYAQNVNADGTLGAALATAPIYGCSNPPLSFAARGRPALGMRVVLEVRNPLNTQPPGSPSLFVLAAQAAPGFPCGVTLPGFGMQGHGTAGELLVDLSAPYLLLGPPLPDADLPLDIPLDLGLLGWAVFAQGVLLDPLPNAVAPIGLARAAQLQFGY